MQRNRLIRYCLYGVLSLLIFSCEYYLGLNQQPEFEDEDIEEGLNVFGVLRPDSIGSYNKSFVYVQKMWPVLQLDSFSIIRGADIRLEHIADNEIMGIINFPLVPADSLFPDTLYRPIEDFIPLPGERYRITCRYEGLPDATGELVFPPEPRIKENSLLIDGRTVSFTLVADSLISMVDIYLLIPGNSQMLDRRIPSGTSGTYIELQLPVDPQGIQLKLFSYDSNMAVYYGNSNTALNFNKYRTTISTLESGFGVFGALNFSIISL